LKQLGKIGLGLPAKAFFSSDRVIGKEKYTCQEI
jgi:hypothetical protein